MNTVRCRISGCPVQFQTADAVAAGAMFVCKNHPWTDAAKAIGRDPEVNPPKKIRFQESQFDKDLLRARHPEGTRHITHQGSDPR